MTQAKPQRTSIRFELAPEIPEHKALIDYLAVKAVDGTASTWIRAVLIAVMTAEEIAIDVPATLEQMRAETANVERLSKTISRQFTGTITTRNVEENPIPAAYAEDDGPDDEPQYVEPEDIA